MKLLEATSDSLSRQLIGNSRFVHVRKGDSTFELRILGSEPADWTEAESYLRNKRIPVGSITSVDTGVSALRFTDVRLELSIRRLRGAALVEADDRIEVLPHLTDVEGHLSVTGPVKLKGIERVDGVLSVSAGAQLPKLVYVSNRVEIDGEPGDRMFFRSLVGIGHHLIISPGVILDAPELRFLGGRASWLLAQQLPDARQRSVHLHASFRDCLGVDPHKPLAGRLLIEVNEEDDFHNGHGLTP